MTSHDDGLPDDPEKLRRMVRDQRLENDLLREVGGVGKKRPRRRPKAAGQPGEDDRDGPAAPDVFAGLFGL
jgi:hypothetical protein